MLINFETEIRENLPTEVVAIDIQVSFIDFLNRQQKDCISCKEEDFSISTIPGK